MIISLSQAINALKLGQVIAVPTETVYGLAACFDNEFSIERIFALKKRPLDNPLIIHVSDVETIKKYTTHVPPGFEELSKNFWPGPLTCILPVKSNVSSLVRAGLPHAGFRIPSMEITQSLLQATGPLVMPSANLSGRPSSTLPQHIEEDFGSEFPILKGGCCQKGVESTILFFQDNEWVILRLGALHAELFQPILGYVPKLKQKDKHQQQPLCPGQGYRHYAPKAHLFLGHDRELFETSFIVGFKERIYPVDKRVLVLGSLSNPEEVAENLYQILRQLDQEGAKQAWVDMDFPRKGLWQTIEERLLRAGELKD